MDFGCFLLRFVFETAWIWRSVHIMFPAFPFLVLKADNLLKFYVHAVLYGRRWCLFLWVNFMVVLHFSNHTSTSMKSINFTIMGVFLMFKGVTNWCSPSPMTYMFSLISKSVNKVAVLLKVAAWDSKIILGTAALTWFCCKYFEISFCIY